ncbi:hypothetical protein [Mesoplasma florum]|uniref:hypothetical protein n=1 Tax=Mesoplasma florum TaxID=2151 RepID=UPI000BE3328E|nr:hypothetical protein [Mesoplasma florum]ATI74140.1 hypothetical protein CQZ70_02695 [Mesoplasma florum]
MKKNIVEMQKKISKNNYFKIFKSVLVLVLIIFIILIFKIINQSINGTPEWLILIEPYKENLRSSLIENWFKGGVNSNFIRGPMGIASLLQFDLMFVNGKNSVFILPIFIDLIISWVALMCFLYMAIIIIYQILTIFKIDQKINAYYLTFLEYKKNKKNEKNNLKNQKITQAKENLLTADLVEKIAALELKISENMEKSKREKENIEAQINADDKEVEKNVKEKEEAKILAQKVLELELKIKKEQSEKNKIKLEINNKELEANKLKMKIQETEELELLVNKLQDKVKKEQSQKALIKKEMMKKKKTEEKAKILAQKVAMLEQEIALEKEQAESKIAQIQEQANISNQEAYNFVKMMEEKYKKEMATEISKNKNGEEKDLSKLSVIERSKIDGSMNISEPRYELQKYSNKLRDIAIQNQMPKSLQNINLRNLTKKELIKYMGNVTKKINS